MYINFNLYDFSIHKFYEEEYIFYISRNFILEKL